MGKLTRIGMDTSKSVFQLHGVDDDEQPVLKRKLRRQDLNKFFGSLPRLRIGMEACGASHHWARELQALGHEVVLIPPQYTKPYVDRGKNDAADAEAICEAMSRPKVQRRFVPPKTLDQQALQMLMVVRNGLVKRRTQVCNAIRGHAAEFGLVSAKGLYRVEELLAKVEQRQEMPELAREMFKVLLKVMNVSPAAGPVAARAQRIANTPALLCKPFCKAVLDIVRPPWLRNLLIIRFLHRRELLFPLALRAYEDGAPF